MATSGKRIAKNTLFLYIRMLLVMVVSLYVSRVILRTLGASDYGIYNVVGGVVAMMSFVNSALSSSTSRYLTYHLGTGDSKTLSRVFSASLNLHITVAILVFVVCESLGLWFMLNKMTIPPDRINAAFWVYQFTIVTTMVTFTQVPYNAALISHEKMSVYAYVGLYEAFSKLLIAYLITVSPIDKLVFYGLLLMVNSIGVCLFYRWYTSRNYNECRFHLFWDKKLYKELASYSGWDLFGNLSAVCQGQGINVLLNVFFCPSINAARAIAFQMQGALKQFARNFLVAVRPQVVKNYAEGRHKEMYELSFTSLRLSLLISMMLILPFIFEIDFVLSLWLGDTYPEETPLFARIILVNALFDIIETAQNMPFHAIGKIKTGNVICGTIMIMSLPISYIALKMGMQPYVPFIIVILTLVIDQILTLIIIKGYVNFSILHTYLNHYLPVIIVGVLTCIPTILLHQFMQEGIARALLTLLTIEMSILLWGWLIGLKGSEKAKVANIAKKKYIQIYGNKNIRWK